MAVYVFSDQLPLATCLRSSLEGQFKDSIIEKTARTFANTSRVSGDIDQALPFVMRIRPKAEAMSAALRSCSAMAFSLDDW